MSRMGLPDLPKFGMEQERWLAEQAEKKKKVGVEERRTVMSRLGLPDLPKLGARPKEKEVQAKPKSSAGSRSWATVRTSLSTILLMSRRANMSMEKAAEDAALAEGRATLALLALVKAAQAERGPAAESSLSKSAAAAAVGAARKVLAQSKSLARQTEAVAARAASAATDATGLLIGAVSASALGVMANRSMVINLVDSTVRSAAPAIRTAIGEFLIEMHAAGGKELSDELLLRVLRPTYDELRRLDPSAEGTSALNMLPVFSVRLHPKGTAPPFEETFGDELNGFPARVLPEMFDPAAADGDEESSRSQQSHRREESADEHASDEHGGHDGEDRYDDGAPDPALAAQFDRGGKWEWPEEWQASSERRHCIVVDFDVSVAVRANWESEPFYFSLESSLPCLPKPLACFALKACVMRFRARCWLHVRRWQLRIALHEGEELSQFKSHAEIGLGGCCSCCGGAMPDHAGLTSRLMLHYLRERLTVHNPLEIDLPQGTKGKGGRDGELRWKSTVTGNYYEIVLPCKEE